jgi:hypothetical protein
VNSAPSCSARGWFVFVRVAAEGLGFEGIFAKRRCGNATWDCEGEYEGSSGMGHVGSERVTASRADDWHGRDEIVGWRVGDSGSRLVVTRSVRATVQ